MTEFACGAAFGAATVLVSLVVFVRVLVDGEEDDGDSWNPWGGSNGR